MTQTSTQTRCTGLIPEETRDPLGHGELRLAGSSNRPSSFMLPRLDEMPVLDQGPIPSCVANACAGAMLHRAVIQGTVGAKLPSRAFLYRAARARMGNVEALTGTRISDVALSLDLKGYPAEWIDPYDPFAILEDPARDSTLAAYQHGWDQRGRCKMQPVSVDDIEGALLAGRPLVCGFEIDAGFHGADLDSAWHLKDRTGDWHAVQIVGYRPDGYVVRNSWGESWGANGLALVSRDTVESGLTPYAISWAPSQSEDVGL